MLLNADARYDQALKDLSAAVVKLFDAARPLREGINAFDPPLESEALRAIDHEHRAGRGEEEFAETVGALAGLLLTGAEDHTRGLSIMLAAGHTSVFAHHALGRAAIEHLARAYSLLDPTKNFDVRVARWFNENLNDLHHLKRIATLVPGADVEEATRAIRARRTQAQELGLPVLKSKKGKGRWVMEERLSSNKAIQRLLDTAGNDSFLGAVLYWQMSGKTHGSQDAIHGIIDEADEEPIKSPFGADQIRRAIRSDATDISLVCEAVIACTHRMLARYLTYFGVDPTPLQQPLIEARNVVSQFNPTT